MFGSVLLPNEAQLLQMRERPWNGVFFGDEYLGSLAGMERLTRAVIASFRAHGVQPIVESKVRTKEDVAKLQSLLTTPMIPIGGGRCPAHSAGNEDELANVPVALASGDKLKGLQSSGTENFQEEARVVAITDIGGSNGVEAFGSALCSKARQGIEGPPSFYPQPRRARRWNSG